VKVYATSVAAVGFVGAEGAEASGAGVLEEGTEDPGAVVEGVGAGLLEELRHLHQGANIGGANLLLVHFLAMR
jgi:hypothetical protein